MVKRNEEMGKGVIVAWFVVILLIPILGLITYHAFTKSSIPAFMRWLIIGGGTAAYLVVLILMMVVSGTI